MMIFEGLLSLRGIAIGYDVAERFRKFHHLLGNGINTEGVIACKIYGTTP